MISEQYNLNVLQSIFSDSLADSSWNLEKAVRWGDQAKHDVNIVLPWQTTIHPWDECDISRPEEKHWAITEANPTLFSWCNSSEAYSSRVTIRSDISEWLLSLPPPSPPPLPQSHMWCHVKDFWKLRHIALNVMYSQ